MQSKSLFFTAFFTVFFMTGSYILAQGDIPNPVVNKVKAQKAQEQKDYQNVQPEPTKDASTLGLIRQNPESTLAAKPKLTTPQEDSSSSDAKEESRGIPIYTSNPYYQDSLPSSSQNNPPAASNAEKQPPADIASPQKPIIAEQPSKSEEKPQLEFKKSDSPRQDVSGIKWRTSALGNFIIKMEPISNGIATPNLSMKFETIHQILKKNIPWMMGGKTNVTVYATRNSFLKNEDLLGDWAGAFYSPEDKRIVMYDDTENTQKMIELFSHELTHLFYDNFFNKDRKIKGEPPIWLNEGLAVNMEDIATNIKGGAWANDLIFLNILSAGDLDSLKANKSSVQKVGDKQKTVVTVPKNSVFFKNFAEFVKEDSYDKAVANNDVENWYLQAYAMVRFLFKPYNGIYPEKRMQFEQLTKELAKLNPKKDADENIVKNSKGQTLMVKPTSEEALRKAYNFRDMKDFETKFWAWLKELRKKELEALRNK